MQSILRTWIYAGPSSRRGSCRGIIYGELRSADLSDLSLERFEHGITKERNVCGGNFYV